MNSVSYDQTISETAPRDLSMQHLHAELARLDLLLGLQIERWRSAGQDPNDAFRGLYVSDHEVGALLQRPLGGSWSDFSRVNDSAYLDAAQEIRNRIKAVVNKAESQGIETRLERLRRMFSLTAFETDVLLLALAPSIDLRYQKIYGYLQDDVTRKAPTVNLALDLFSDPADRNDRLPAFNPDAPLYRFQILAEPNTTESLLGRPLNLDPAIAAWLLGHYHPEGLVISRTPDPDTVLPEMKLPVYDAQLIVSFTGADTFAKNAACRSISGRCEKPHLVIDTASAENEGLMTLVQRKLRDAQLLDAIPIFTNWDVVLVDDAPPKQLFEAVVEFPGMVVIQSKSTWRPRGVQRTRRIYRMDFPVPVFRSRLSTWQRLLDEHPDLQKLDLTHLAGQFALTTGQILDAFEAARDDAAQEQRMMDTDDLLSAARSHSNPRLGALARKIDPRFDWDDIILPNEQIAILQEISSTVRQRPKVLDEWGVGEKLASSRGVTVLFAGPPGTGKTMAAEIMSAELGLDLYKIDLSGVVSKYIGETEKNLEKVFEEAASSNAILFFDEADALFGKRSEVRDAHDRYANLEISYLLQRMEAYDGMTILATNLRANLDEAFTRRLQFAVDFPFPEAPDRLRIWQALFPSTVPCDPALDFSLMAHRFKMAGGNIRNVIVNAAYLAAADGGTVTMTHMLHATRRELQKMGRLVNEEDLIPLAE